MRIKNIQLPVGGHLECIPEGIIYHTKIARGLEDARAGRTLTIEEFERHLDIKQ